MFKMRLFELHDIDRLEHEKNVPELINALRYYDKSSIQYHIADFFSKITRFFSKIYRFLENKFSPSYYYPTITGGPLLRILCNKDIDIRSRAAEALGRIGDQRAVEPLIKALLDRYSTVIISSANALGKIGDPRASEPLLRAFDRACKEKDSKLSYNIGIVLENKFGVKW
jgi:hypothetical protein